MERKDSIDSVNITSSAAVANLSAYQTHEQYDVTMKNQGAEFSPPGKESPVEKSVVVQDSSGEEDSKMNSSDEDSEESSSEEEELLTFNIPTSLSDKLGERFPPAHMLGSATFFAG